MTQLLTSQIGSGSYQTDDIQFLLRPLNISPTDVAQKEHLIQSGQKHYSEMISTEHAPSANHQAIFEQALAQGGARMAQAVQSLALALLPYQVNGQLTLLSLVRAGVPLGVLLTRALRDMGVTVAHYGISIIRDRGIDVQAINDICQVHAPQSLIFVDGWTGKGAIAKELAHTLTTQINYPIEPRLVTLTDPCGVAWLAAAHDDWLIPSGILGATVSGLVSRSIWPQDVGWHGCVRCDDLQPFDNSRYLIETVNNLRQQLAPQTAAVWPLEHRNILQAASQKVISDIATRFNISSINRIKPGIAEATRAVMRRVPEHVLVNSKQDNDVRLLVQLAQQAGVAVEEVGQQLHPYRALTIIKKVG